MGQLLPDQVLLHRGVTSHSYNPALNMIVHGSHSGYGHSINSKLTFHLVAHMIRAEKPFRPSKCRLVGHSALAQSDSYIEARLNHPRLMSYMV